MLAIGKRQRSPTGLTLWPLVQNGQPTVMSLVWPGPGSGLFLGIDATQPTGSMNRIEGGPYYTFVAAKAAASVFVGGANTVEMRRIAVAEASDVG